MKLTAALIEEGLRNHHAKMELEAERLTNEIWAAVFGAPQGDAPRKRWRCRGSGRLLFCPDPTHHHNDGCYSDYGGVVPKALGPFDDEGDDEDDEN